MKILMLTDRMDCGGAETHLLELASSLVSLGHTVCVVSSGGSLVDELMRRGVRHVTMPLDSPRAVLFCGRLARLVRRGGFDIIHSHARIASFVASMVSARTGVCFVSTAHARFSTACWRRRLSKWGQRTIAVSEDLGQYLCESYGLYRENVSVIPNGVDSSRFYPDLQARGGAVRIAFLSRLDSDCSTGAFLLCDVARSLAENFGAIEIVIGGGGEELGRVRERADRVNRSLGFECVKVVGKVNDTPSFLRGTDIFVGVSRAAIEASFCGASVILCGDEGFMGELHEDNFALALSTNFCARGEKKPSASALYSVLASLLSLDDTLRLERAMTVRSLMLGECDLTVSVRRTIEFYRRALHLPSREPTVLLCGYYGFGNMGDDALLVAAISRARREFAGASVVAITKNGELEGSRFGIACISRRDAREALGAIKECRYFVFGGGTLLQDLTSKRSLYYYSTLLALAKRYGARCYLWGNGIGEPRDKKSAEMIRRAITGCEYIGLRDARSVDIARKLLGENIQLSLESDLALSERVEFKISEARERYILRDVPTSKRFIIVALKGERCPRELDDIMRCAAEKGTNLVFVVMLCKQDERISRELCKKYSGILKTGIDFADLIALARHSSGVYSMRLHALVAAKIADVAFFGFGDTKVKDFEKR